MTSLNPSTTIAPDNDYNLTSDYEVVLDHPIDKAFHVLGHGDNVEDVVRLSPICAMFEFVDKNDFVATYNGAPLSSSRVRTAPSAPSPAAESQDAASSKLYPRRHFHFVERVPILFGAAHTNVDLYGTHTWDEAGKVALYETHTPRGIDIWKLRRFEAVEEDKKQRTKVMESIRGKAPALLKGKVEKDTRKGHREHMDKFNDLVSSQ